MTERDWKNLLGNLRSGNCVLFAGPGMTDSQSLDGLGRHLAEVLRQNGHAVNGRTLPSIAEQFDQAPRMGGRTALLEEARQFWSNGSSEPGPLEVALASGPFTLVLTTLLDERLFRAFQRNGRTPRSARYHVRDQGGVDRSLFGPWLMQEPLLYHLHGRLQDQESVVLTEDEHIAFLKAVVADNPPLPKSIAAKLRDEETSFLFVGFGLRHPYLKFFLSHFRAPRKNDSFAVEGATAQAFDDDDAVLFYDGQRIGFREISIARFAAELRRRVAIGGPPPPPARTPVTKIRPRVFISYASEDGRSARLLFEGLEGEGFDVWLDKVRLEGGDRWDPAIRDEIARSDYILVLQSRALEAKTDSYVNREITLAIDRAMNVRRSVGGDQLRCVVPLQIEPCNLIDDLNEYQTVPLGLQDYPSEFAGLVKLLKRDDQLRRREEAP